MNNLCGINIDFPKIEGSSEKQIWYAENLREAYISRHEDRFIEIAEMVETEIDRRICDNGYDNICDTFSTDFNDAEKTCLFGINAGGIIATLKAELENERLKDGHIIMQQ